MLLTSEWYSSLEREAQGGRGDSLFGLVLPTPSPPSVTRDLPNNPPRHPTPSLAGPQWHRQPQNTVPAPSDSTQCPTGIGRCVLSLELRLCGHLTLSSHERGSGITEYTTIAVSPCVVRALTAGFTFSENFFLLCRSLANVASAGYPRTNCCSPG